MCPKPGYKYHIPIVMSDYKYHIPSHAYEYPDVGETNDKNQLKMLRNSVNKQISV